MLSFKKVNIQLKKISVNLRKVSSLFYLLVYLAFIPAFAGIFMFFPAHFYHSTIKHEKSYILAEEELKEALYKSLDQCFLQSSTSKESGYYNYSHANGEHMLQILKSKHKRLKTTPKSFLLPVGAILLKKLEDKSYLYLEDEQFDIEISNEFSVCTWDDGIMSVNINFNSVKSAKIKEILKSKVKFPVDGSKKSILIKKRDTNLMSNFINASKGFPHKISDNYLRMLYLSASTLTTLGLGDITPISSLARFLIILETIVGIVLIGLYVNSLGNEILSHKNENT